MAHLRFGLNALPSTKRIAYGGHYFCDKGHTLEPELKEFLLFQRIWVCAINL